MEDLYRQDKVLTEDAEWEQIGRSSRYTLRARCITVDRDTVLDLVGEYYAQGQYSFGLRYSNTMIRVWDFNNHHEGIEGGHKHRYPEDESVEDDPYSVNDVTTSNPNQAIIQFMDEANIEPNGFTIGPIPALHQYE